MNLSTWAIRKPAPSILLFIMITVAGLIGFHRLGVQSFPDLDLPAVTVVANLPGAAPPQLESEVTRPIENAVASIGAVKHISSTLSDGVSSTVIEFELEKNMQEAISDVRDAVTRIRSTLPSALQEPVVSRVNFSGESLLTYSVTSSSMDESDLSWFVDNTIGKKLLPVTGVGQVARLGGVSREVQIELKPIRLQTLDVTAGEISRQIRSVEQEASSGRGNLGGLEQSMRTIGTLTSADQLADLNIPLADGRRIRLGDVATVRDGIAERRQLALLNGKPIISFEVKRARGFDEVSVAAAVRKAVAQLQGEYPQIQIEEIANSVQAIQASYEASMHTLYEGAILAMIVVWLFLRDWRATFVSAIALPLSVIPTFAVMAMFGFTLNTITLLALTLVVGILVDDAIVEVENIMRHLRDGKPPRQAAMEAATEIGLAVVATSLTLVAVFLPTAFMGGIPGKVFKQFGWTAALSVLFSLLVARLLTPMMAAYFLKRPSQHEAPDGWIMQRYLNTVRWCLANPKRTSIAAAIFFGASLLMITALPTGFLNAEDRSRIIVTLEGPPGSTLAQTQRVAEQANKLLQSTPEVLGIYTTIGAGVTGPGSSVSSAAEIRTATLKLHLKEIRDRKRSQEEITASLKEKLQVIPGVRITTGGGGFGEKLSLTLLGDDPTALHQATRAIINDMRKVPALSSVTSSESLVRPEIVIRPDFNQAARLGVTSAAIGDALRIATSGDYDFNLPRLNLPERQIYIRLQLDPESRRDLATIAQLRVQGTSGSVPLENIAKISVEDGPAQISRFDRNRNINLNIDIHGLGLGELAKLVDKLPSIKNLPAGVHRGKSGDLEEMAELFGGFLLAMAAGIFCVYAIMVLLFHDFSQPVTVLAALPLAAGGAFGLLVLFGYSLSLPSLIGLLMLIGIVTKNSILLVEYAITARRDLGLSRADALIDACHKRARPIVMTTVAMVAGMMPMALNLEGDPGFRAPMAVVVIGGLLTSTVLSLIVVPVVFEMVDELKLAVGRRFRRHVSGQSPELNAGT